MRIILTLLFIILISGCAKRKIENKYYLIEPLAKDSLIIFQGNALINAACQVVPVEMYPAFASSRIAHRSESHQITYYTHHQWAVLPDVLLTQIIEHDLKLHNLFTQVDSRLRTEPGYVLETEVLQLETITQKNDLSAHLNINFRIMDAIDQRVLLQHNADRVEPLQKNDLNLFAEAINQIMHQELQLLAGKIKSELVE